MVRKHLYMLSVYSFAHFCVDFACAFLMFRSVSASSNWYVCILVYNFCAFAMQMPLGVVADKLDRNHAFAGAGCLMVGAAFALMMLPQAEATALAATVVLGLGNGMFHIGGGIDVLNISARRSGALGVFVSPGAFGVYFGTIIGKGAARLDMALPYLMLVLSISVFMMRRIRGEAHKHNEAFSISAPRGVLVAAALFFVVVCLRSFTGMSLPFPWKGSGQFALILVCATVAGKAAGGFLFDKFGPLKTVFFSLVPAAALFFFPGVPAPGVAAVLLFNMTMPVTLWAMARLFPGAKGFSFGLLTFGLFLGFLPVYLGVGSAPGWAFAIIALVSMAMLLLGLLRVRAGVES